MKFDFEVSAYDVQEYLEGPAKEFDSGGDLRFGKVKGNVLNINVDKLPRIDFAIAGPPCPPWSSIGNHGGFNDPRSRVFRAVVDIITRLGARGDLRGFVIENVPGIRKVLPPILKKLVRSGWHVTVTTLNAIDFHTPQARVRSFIVGARRSCPCVVRPFNTPVVPVMDILAKDMPSVRPEDLTDLQQCTLSMHKAKLRALLVDCKYRGHVVIVDLSRSFGCAWQNMAWQDKCPTLTTSNEHLFVFSLGEQEVGSIAYDADAFSIHRFISMVERFSLQGLGFSRFSACTKKQMLCITGNSIPVPMLGAVLANCIEAACSPGTEKRARAE